MPALSRLGIDEAVVNGGDAVSPEQKQTQSAFAFKWKRRDSYDSPAMRENSRRWLIERYCGGDVTAVDRWLEGGRKIILDVGCGSAFSALLLFGERLRDHDYLGVDISDAVDVARTRMKEAGLAGEFMKSDLMSMPVPDGSVDLILSEGVLHHTDNTEAAIKSVARKLKVGGRFLFYVYAKKSVVREFTDDDIRAQLQDSSDDEAWEALYSLSKLGKALGELNVTVNVPEDVPLLGIPQGPIDLQRLFYWHICKMYYRPELSLDEMNHINFDWFRPLNCHRQTPEEVQQWCREADLVIERLQVEDAGITVVARREEPHKSPRA